MFKIRIEFNSYNGLMRLELRYRMSYLGLSSYHVHATYIQPNIKLYGVKLVKIVYIFQNEIKQKGWKKKIS